MQTKRAGAVISFGIVIFLLCLFFSTNIVMADDWVQVSRIDVLLPGGVDSIFVGSSIQMDVNIQPVDATDKTVTWTVENGAGSAIIDSTGLLTGTSVGDVVVMAAANDNSGITGQLVLTIKEKSVTSIEINTEKDRKTLKVGDAIKINTTVLPADATNKGIQWSITSGNEYATIDQTGLLTGVTYGSVVVRASATDGSGVFGEYTITVVPFYGNGTQEDPFLITNSDDLLRLAWIVNSGDHNYATACYNQTSDIDLAGFENWIPIGYLHMYNGVTFSGTYDGSKHKIYGLNVNISDSGNVYAGLFGYVSTSGNIMNLSVVDCKVSAAIVENYTTAYAGGIAGWCSEGATISNCSTSGSVTAVRKSIAAVAGGIAGQNNGSIIRCYNSAIVTAYNAGGIAGEAIDSSVRNCYNAGICRGSNVGGIIGYSYGSFIERCYSVGYNIGSSGDSYAGGIVARIGKTTVSYCYFIDNAIKDTTYVIIPGATELTDLQMRQSDSFAGFDFGSEWEFGNLVYPYPILRCNDQSNFPSENTIDFDGGNGTSYSPYKVSTREQLDNIRKYLSSCFTLENDVKFSSSDFSSGGQYYNSGRCWIPIGNDTSPFAGVLNGNGHRIIGIKSIVTSDGDAYAGLFGYIDTCIINAVVLEGCNIVSNSSVDHGYSGGITGVMHGGTIYRCFSTGVVNGDSNAGGIVGKLFFGRIEYCHNEGEISGGWANGGIVGTNNGCIRECFNVGIVRYGTACGGVVGFNTGNVYDCYNISSVAGSFAGGISGQGYGNIRRCYNVGKIGSSTAGGIAGSSSGNISDCYFLDTTGLGVGYGSTIGTLKCTDSQMQQKGTYSGFDFTNVWVMEDPIPDGTVFKYPQLRKNKYRQIYAVTVAYDGNGYATGSGMFGSGDTVILSSRPNGGYRFAGWDVLSGSIQIVNLDNTTASFIMPDEPVSIKANFEKVPYVVTLKNNGYGSVSGDGYYVWGSNVTISAHPNAGYRFKKWVIESGTIYLPNTYAPTTSFNMPLSNVTIKAEFESIQYVVTLEKEGNGTVSGAGVYSLDSIATVTAIPDAGYQLVRWLEGQDIVSTSNQYSFAVTGDITLKAVFTPVLHNVTFSSQGGTAVTPKTAPYNTTITAPTPPTRSGYVFQGWYKESACTTPWNFATDKVTADITLYAKWVSTTPAAVKAASASYTSIKVTWNAVPGASGYQVYYATSSAGPWTLKGTVTSAGFAHTGLITGKYYYYKVRSYIAAKVYSGFSAVVSARPIPATPYSVKAARASSTSVKITWGAISGATRYEVWRSTSAAGTFTMCGTTASLYYINGGLTAGRTYYYKVRCYHLEGSVKVYSAFSGVVSGKP